MTSLRSILSNSQNELAKRKNLINQIEAQNNKINQIVSMVSKVNQFFLLEMDALLKRGKECNELLSSITSNTIKQTAMEIHMQIQNDKLEKETFAKEDALLSNWVKGEKQFLYGAKIQNHIAYQKQIAHILRHLRLKLLEHEQILLQSGNE